jgi:hypothetical protein
VSQQTPFVEARMHEVKNQINWLSQVKFLVVKLIYSVLNIRFDISIVFIADYSFS